MCSPSSYRFFTCALANATGTALLVPQYGLAPEAPYPEQILDFFAALNKCNEIFNPHNLFLGGTKQKFTTKIQGTQRVAILC
jgi:acetyl esterase/lipase